MYRFLQKNNKKLLAVFAVFLMIVFVLPTTFTGVGSPGDRVMAHIGPDEDELTASQFQQAHVEWELLNRPLPQLQISLAMALLSPDVAGRINEHPEMYLLLQEEARRMGVTLNQDRLQTLLTNELPALLPPDPDEKQIVSRGVENLMLIQAAFGRAASTVKVSAPMRERMIGSEMQSIGVKLVEFDAKDFAAQVPPPTTQQVQEQFTKFAAARRADATSDDPMAPPPPSKAAPTTNPFGFGYQYPDRVKLQYIAIPRADVRKAVEASRSPYEWEVEARKFYQRNPSQFPATRPATRPTGVPFTLEPAATQATTGPTTKPFAEVREDIQRRIIEPLVDQRITAIASRISGQMTSDFATLSNAPSSSSSSGSGAAPPATQPTALGAPLRDFAYMSKLAEAIQKEFGVLPTVVSLEDEWRSEADLRALQNIGSATGPGGYDFPSFATQMAETVVPADQRGGANVLSLYEPSRPFRDYLGNTYIFRLTAAEPAHAPQSADEVADAVRADVTAAQTHEQAKAAATKLLDAARQSDLEQAATAAGKPVVATGTFRHSVPGEIPAYPALTNATAQQRFRDQAFDLLSQPPSGDGKKPVALIELPRVGKVLVAQLADVKAEWRPDGRYLLDQGALAALSQREVQQFAEDWFNYDNVVARLNYRSEEGSAPAGPARPAQPRPPMF